MAHLKTYSLAAGVILCLTILAFDPFCYFVEMLLNWQDEPGMTGVALEAALAPDYATLSATMTEDGLARWGDPPTGYAALITETLYAIQSHWFPGLTTTLTATLAVGAPYSNTTSAAAWGPYSLVVPIYLIWPGPPPEAYGVAPGARLVVACIGMEETQPHGTPEPLFTGAFVAADYIDPLATPVLGLPAPLCPSGITPTPTPSPTPVPTATPNYGCCERDLSPPNPINGNTEECFNYHGSGCPGGWERLPGESCHAHGDCD